MFWRKFQNHFLRSIRSTLSVLFQTCLLVRKLISSIGPNYQIYLVLTLLICIRFSFKSRNCNIVRAQRKKPFQCVGRSPRERSPPLPMTTLLSYPRLDHSVTPLRNSNLLNRCSFTKLFSQQWIKFTFLRKENQGFLTLLSIWLKSWNSNFWEPSDRSTDLVNYFLSNNHRGREGL